MKRKKESEKREENSTEKKNKESSEKLGEPPVGFLCITLYSLNNIYAHSFIVVHLLRVCHARYR